MRGKSQSIFDVKGLSDFKQIQHQLQPSFSPNHQEKLPQRPIFQDKSKEELNKKFSQCSQNLSNLYKIQEQSIISPQSPNNQSTYRSNLSSSSIDQSPFSNQDEKKNVYNSKQIQNSFSKKTIPQQHHQQQQNSSSSNGNSVQPSFVFKTETPRFKVKEQIFPSQKPADNKNFTQSLESEFQVYLNSFQQHSEIPDYAQNRTSTPQKSSNQIIDHSNSSPVNNQSFNLNQYFSFGGDQVRLPQQSKTHQLQENQIFNNPQEVGYLNRENQPFKNPNISNKLKQAYQIAASTKTFNKDKQKQNIDPSLKLKGTARAPEQETNRTPLSPFQQKPDGKEKISSNSSPLKFSQTMSNFSQSNRNLQQTLPVSGFSSRSPSSINRREIMHSPKLDQGNQPKFNQLNSSFNSRSMTGIASKRDSSNDKLRHSFDFNENMVNLQKSTSRVNNQRQNLTKSKL